MRKRTAILVCIALSAVLLFGACSVEQAQDTATPGPVPNNDVVIVVAEVNGEPIYRDEFLSVYSQMYMQYAQYGFPEDMIKPMAMDEVVNQKVSMITLEQQGFMDLTSEEEEQAQNSAQEQLDNYIEYMMTQIEEELGEGYSDEELQAKIEEYTNNALLEAGITMEDFVDSFRKQIAYEKGYEALVGDIEPAEEEVREKYDTQLAQDKETIGEDAAAYEMYTSQGRIFYYVPEGLRRVRQILIGLDEETVSKISELRAAEDDKAADELLEESLAGIQERADEVLTKLKKGEITFEEAIETYNDDPGMEYSTEGYLIASGSETYVAPFAEGAMSLENVGDFTDLVASDFGYHIIEYTSDVEAGPVSYESVKEDIFNELAPQMQQQAWSDLVAEWKEGMDVVIDEDKM